MWALARPVRVDARLDWNVETAWSMRRRRSAFNSFTAIVRSSLELEIANGYSTKCGTPSGQRPRWSAQIDFWRGAMPSDQEILHELSFYTLQLGDPEFIHQHVVDAYAVQHAGPQSKPIAIVFGLIG